MRLLWTLLGVAQATATPLDLDDLVRSAGNVPDFVEDADALGDLALPPLETDDSAPADMELPDPGRPESRHPRPGSRRAAGQNAFGKSPGRDLSGGRARLAAAIWRTILDIESLMGAEQALDDHEAAANDLTELTMTLAGADGRGIDFPVTGWKSFSPARDDPGPACGSSS